MDIQKLIEDNPSLMIYLVCGVALLFIAGFIMAKIVNARKRKKLREEKGMAEIVFDSNVLPASRMVTDLQFAGYKVYSVNGQEPKLVGKGIVVDSGKCSIEIEYIDTEYSNRRKSLTTLYGKQMLELNVEKGIRYKVTFNEKEGEFKVQEM